MNPQDDNNLTAEPALENSGQFSLEEILAEYGGSLEQQLLRSVEQPSAANAEPEAASAAAQVKSPEPETKATAPEGKPSPAVAKAAAPGGKPSPAVAKAAAPGEKPSPAVTKAAVPGGKPSPAVAKAAAPGEKSSPAVTKAAAPGEKSSPAVTKAAAPGEKSSPAVTKVAAPGEKPSPAVTKAATPGGQPSAVETNPAEAASPEAKPVEDTIQVPAPPPKVPPTKSGMNPPPPFPDPLAEAEAAAKAEAERLKLPRPRPISLEDVVGSTVEAVMEEAKEPLLPSPKRRLFSRRPMADTENLPPPPKPEPSPDPEPIGPEPELWEVSHDARQIYIRRKHSVLLPLITALPPTLALVLERYKIKIPYWSGQTKVQCAFTLVCLLLTAMLCRYVFTKGFSMLLRRRCVSELLVSLSVLVSAADCAAQLIQAEPRTAAPYAAVSCLALVFAQWGVRRESKGNYDMFRAAAIDDEPPYLVTNTPQGACKQRGSVPGFYTTAVRSDAAANWQAVLLPVFLAAAVIFAVLSSVGQERSGDFLLNLSAILPAAATYSLPLCWALPWSKLSEHLQRTGCAVAGWSGAQKISARRRMIVTDGDLFPPGTVQLNGRKLYGEEPERALSLAASMARAAGSGLERLFNNLIRSEGGRYEKVDDFSFYEEGGYSGTIRGEAVLMGSASFMRKMNVRLPQDVNLRTGIFLAVDKELAAVFAVKYNASENVAFALQMMQRSRIQPVLASRDPNITPSLIKRKFSRTVHMEYPGLSERIALSEAEKDRDIPRALLFREGLLPYAEAVAGSQRLCKAVRRAAALSLLGSWAGTLLTFYLTSLGAYDLMNPLALEVFLLLWTLPVLLMADWTGRY